MNILSEDDNECETPLNNANLAMQKLLEEWAISWNSGKEVWEMNSEIFHTHDMKMIEIVRRKSCECSWCGGTHKPHRGDKIVVNNLELD